jgi:hypothetical protein
VDNGIYIVGDKSWSIDMQRYNFQSIGQRFFRIRNGWSPSAGAQRASNRLTGRQPGCLRGCLRRCRAARFHPPQAVAIVPAFLTMDGPG